MYLEGLITNLSHDVPCVLQILPKRIDDLSAKRLPLPPTHSAVRSRLRWKPMDIFWVSTIHFSRLSSESQNFRPSMHALICSVVHFQDLEFSILSSHTMNGSNADIAQRCLTDSSGKSPTTSWADSDSTCAEVVI